MSASLPRLGSGERQLLLSCARVDLDAGQEAIVTRLLEGPLDWDAVVFFARLHSVAPLLHRHVKRLGDRHALPPDARRRLLALAQGTAYRNRIFARQNALLVDALAREGIPVVVPKGLSMAELVYRDVGLRPLIDLIFLVAHRDLSQAGGVLGARGYSGLTVRPVRALYEWSCPQGWYVKDDGADFPVLLQAELVNWPRRHRFSADGVWERVRPARLGGQKVLVLCPTDLVLYLSLQADANGYFNRAALATTDPVELLLGEWSNNRLIRFTDIHEAVVHHRHELDWELLVARARMCGIEDAAQASLTLSNRLLGSPIPADALETLSSGHRPRVRRALLGVVTQSHRRSSLAPLASGWAKLSPARQTEVMRLVGLLEFAFPGRDALRADHGCRSRPTLAWRGALQAARVLSRSFWGFLEASWSRRAAGNLTGWMPAAEIAGAEEDRRTSRG